MSLSEPKIPSTEAKQNHPCIKDAVVVVESSLQDHGDQEEATFQFDPGPHDPEALEAAVPEDSSSTSSTESDSEEFSGGGYTLLPQEPEEEKPSDWITSGGVNRGQLEPHSDTRTDGSSAAVGPVSRLEESQVEAIKQAMAGFSLPTSAVPQWAKVVPEDVWKAELIGGLQTKPKCKPK